MRIAKEDIPVVMQAPDTVMRALPGIGGMTASFHEMPRGTDFTPLLKGLHNDSCHCPHWGYIFEGTFRIIYDDGREEMMKAGDVFYMPPGHTAIVEEDIKLVEFSPTREMDEVFSHVQSVMAEMGG